MRGSVVPTAFEHAVVAGAAYDLPETLLFVLALATIGTGLVLLIAVAGYLRRRSTPYLLVVVAVSALFVRSLVGFGTLYGHVPMGTHHFLEHGLDFLIAVCVLTAVYLMGSPAVDYRSN